MTATTPTAARSARPAPAVSARMRSSRADRAALAVPSVVAAIVTLWWFPWDRFLAAGDVTPFLRDGDARELFDLWNHRATGAGSTSASAARALEVLLIRVTGVFGGSEVVAQHLFYALVMAFAAFGAAYLARAFVSDPIAVGAAGLLGSLNVFVLIHLPNPLTMIWLGLVGTLGGMLVRVARGAPISPVAFAAVTLPASYLSLNPPLLMTAALAVVAVACGGDLLVGSGGARRAWRFLGRAVPWAVGLNFWWIVPTVLATVAREGLEVSAVTRVEDWSWSHARNSVPNVLTFTADWGWVHRDYMPYAQGLDAFPWTLLRWVLPLLAIAALFLVRGRRRVAAWTLVGAALAATFLAKGLHWPFESVNLWAYHHVPGLWLLRDPVSKVGGVLLLSMVVLAAMTIEALLARLARAPSPRVARLGTVALGGAVCLALAFPYPLLLGRIGPDGRGALPSARVAVPGEWHELASAVNASPRRGKALVLPLDPYYQVTTDWGFHGADELASQLLARPVLSLLPDGYFSPAGTLPEMLRAVERELLGGRGDRAAKLLQLLGVSHVILRDDLAAGQVVREVSDRDVLAVGLALTPGLGVPRDFGVAQVYPATDPTELVWAPTSVTGLVRRDDDRTVAALAALPTRGAAVAPGAAPVDDLSWEAPDRPSASVDFELRHGGRYEIGLEETTPTRYRLRVAERGGEAMLKVFDPVAVTLDGEPIGAPPVASIRLRDPDVVAVALGDAMVITNHGLADVDIESPMHLTAYAASGRSARGDRFAPVGECGPRAPGSEPPSAKHIRGGRRITASSGVACVTFPGPTLAPDNAYRVRFQSRGSSEGKVRACLWMNGPDRCASMPTVTTSRGWTTFDTVVRTDQDTTGLVLYLYADASAGDPAVSEYRKVVLTPLEAVGDGDVAPTERESETRDLARGEHRLSITQPTASVPLVASSPLGDCQRSDDRTPEEAGLAVEPIDGGVRLRADAHSACVTAAIPPDLATGEVALSMEVRTVRGRAARLCLWQDGPNQCAELPPLPASPEWHPYRAEVTLAPGTTSARVYLYADGVSSGTVVEYRRLRARPVAPEIVNVTPAELRGATPTVDWDQDGAGAFTAEVSGGPYPALLVLDESFGDGWRVEGAPAARHAEVNGYANGWVLASGGDLGLRYGPSRWARFALVISALVVVAAIGLSVHRRRPRRRGPPRVSGPPEPSGSPAGH